MILVTGTVLSDIATYLPSDFLSGSIYLGAVPFLGTGLSARAYIHRYSTRECDKRDDVAVDPPPPGHAIW